MELTVHYEEKPAYQIIIEKDYGRLVEALSILSITNRKICIVTESTVAPYYAKEVQKLLAPYVKQIIIHTFPAGEVNKNLGTVQELYRDLIQHKFERTDMLLALGGGVVGDLTGYTAATYLRGIDFAQLPTSLLSQVDSSIGGKTGVDFDCYKNMVGAFYQPKLVYMNLSTLKTLSDREYFSGMGEIIKHGLIKDASYYQWLISKIDLIKARDLSVLEEMIYKSCEIKRAVVEHDPKEKGERAMLNFGHTLGHAIEKLMQFSLLHGECVGLGMLAAAEISRKRGLIDKALCNSIKNLLNRLGMPTNVTGIFIDDIIEASKNDKKMEQGKVKFILLNQCGQAFIDRCVSDLEMKEALQTILEE